jgi:hypothetical protein
MKKQRVYRERNGQMRVVENWVRRIDWALRELLPGKTDEQFVVYTRADFETHYHTAPYVSLRLSYSRSPRLDEKAPSANIYKKKGT